MAWIELHQSVATHRKTLALADELNIEPAAVVGHLSCFWLWALDNAPDGDVSSVTTRTMARAAHWKRDAVKWVDALVDVRFLDRTPECLRIHNWDKYAGRLLERRRRDAERKRTERGSPADVHAPSGGHAEDIPTMSDASRAHITVPDRTVPIAPNGAAREAVPRPNRSSEVIDAIRALGQEPNLTERDHKAIKASNAKPEMIAEVYCAVFRGDYGDGFMQRRLSVHEAIGWIDGYRARKTNGPPKIDRNGHPEPPRNLIDRTGIEN